MFLLLQGQGGLLDGGVVVAGGARGMGDAGEVASDTYVPAPRYSTKTLRPHPIITASNDGNLAAVSPQLSTPQFLGSELLNSKLLNPKPQTLNS